MLFITNIYNILKEADIKYQVYVHTFYISRPYSNKRAKEPELKLNNELYQLLKPDFFEMDNQDIIDKSLDLIQYKTKSDPWQTNYETFDNHIRALYSLYRVTQLYKEKDYDYIIYLRPDVLYLNPINLLWLLNNDESINIPDFHSYPINDRFAICKKSTAIIYGERFTESLQYSINNNLHSETFLKYILDNANINIKTIPVRFRRVRATGEIQDLDVKET